MLSCTQRMLCVEWRANECTWCKCGERNITVLTYSGNLVLGSLVFLPEMRGEERGGEESLFIPSHYDCLHTPRPKSVQEPVFIPIRNDRLRPPRPKMIQEPIFIPSHYGCLHPPRPKMIREPVLILMTIYVPLD